MGGAPTSVGLKEYERVSKELELDDEEIEPFEGIEDTPGEKRKTSPCPEGR